MNGSEHSYYLVFEDVIQRSWHSGNNVEEKDPEAERHIEGALQRGHLAQDHERVPHCVPERSRHCQVSPVDKSSIHVLSLK